jgi:hypothetical protein
MTFVDFLNWLWQQIDKVLQWFGDDYKNFINTVLNIWKWVIQEATIVYNNAVTYVTGVINDVIAFINDEVTYLSQYASDLFNEVYNYAVTVYNKAMQAVKDAIAWLTTLATNFYNAAVKKIAEAIATVEAWANALLDAAIQAVTNLFKPLLVLKPVLDLLLKLTTGNIVTILISLAQTFYSEIVAFFNDPIGFMLSLIWTQFITFLCYALGYGLGSIKYQLPAIPAWGKNLGGGGGNPPVIPPNPNATLVHPVDPLYVSGYTFGTGHYGTDFGIVDGQEIHAAHDGVVSFAGWDSSGYGNRIDISGNPYWSRYGHNKQFLVTEGQTVSAGQVIAYGDSTGNSSGPHCHFELKINGVYVDPVLYL